MLRALLLRVKLLPRCRSLSPSCPAKLLLGNLVQESDQARFLFVRKYTLVRPPADPQTLVGYMACFPSLLLEGLKLSLEQWSDGSALRHMTEEYHLRLSGFIALAAVCLGKNDVLLPSASG